MTAARPPALKTLRRLEKLAAGVSLLARQWPGGRAPLPLAAYFLLTYRCNQACDFCFLRELETGDRTVDLDFALAEKILAQLPRRTVASFSGGEPLCHPRALDIVELAARHHRVSLITNGTLLDDNPIERLVAAAPRRFGGAGLTILGVSLFEPLAAAALAEKTKTLEALRRARERIGRAGPLVDLKIVLRRDVAISPAGYLAFLQRDLADVLTFQLPNDLLYPPYYDRGVRPEEPATRRREPLPAATAAPNRETWLAGLRVLRESPECRSGRVRFYPDIPPAEMARFLTGEPLQNRYRCTFPWTGVMISPRGNAFLCRHPEPESLVAQSFRRAWNGENFRRFRRTVRDEDVGATCPGCCFLRED
ncbi:MAG: radical SAM protein [Myxococcales bacterium]|nr:radical SAM protein [Myxococcales bacterium]